MDIGNFKVSGAAPAAVPPPGSGPAPTPVPVAMAAQEPPSPVDLTAAAAPAEQPAASAETTAAEVLASAETQPAQEPAVEQPKAEQPTKVDPRFSALARKEAELHRQREAMKAEKDAIRQAHAQVVAFEEAKQAAKRDPLAALEALGLTYEQITEQMLNGKQPTASAEVAQVREELQRLRVEQEASRAKAEAAAAARLQAEQQAIIEEARTSAVAHVEANASRYELTTINNAATLVPQVREQHFARTGQLLTIEQAADLVEKHFEGIADRVAKAQKVQTKLQQRAAPAPAATPPAAQRTLSNALTASTSTAPAGPRTDADRIRAALARLEGK